jgi:hypothetical protein
MALRKDELEFLYISRMLMFRINPDIAEAMFPRILSELNLRKEGGFLLFDRENGSILARNLVNLATQVIELSELNNSDFSNPGYFIGDVPCQFSLTEEGGAWTVTLTRAPRG